MSSDVQHSTKLIILRLMEDLPAGFTDEWGAWCREKKLFFLDKFYGKTIPVGTYKNFSIPTFAFTTDNDEICTERSLHNL